MDNKGTKKVISLVLIVTQRTNFNCNGRILYFQRKNCTFTRPGEGAISLRCNLLFITNLIFVLYGPERKKKKGNQKKASAQVSLGYT